MLNPAMLGATSVTGDTPVCMVADKLLIDPGTWKYFSKQAGPTFSHIGPLQAKT